MPTTFLFSLLASAMGYFALGVLALCIACGLYCASELAEEYSSIALRLIKASFAVVFSLHVLLVFAGVDTFPVVVSALCHVAYLSLLSKFPFVDPYSVSVGASCVAACANQYFWFHFFLRNFTPILQVSGFFVVVTWSIPIMLFVSLTVDELPMRGGGGGYSSSSDENNGGIAGTSKGSSIFHSLSDKVLESCGGFLKANAPGIKKAF